MSDKPESCGNCKFFTHDPPDPRVISFTTGDTDHVCRRYPPLLLPDTFRFRSSSTSHGTHTYPMVSDDMWCGEWKL